MPKSQDIKSRLLRRMAQHVLAHGLSAASLRPLAAAAQTSDRMLIYHFGSKDRLMAELLQYLALQLSEKLDAALPTRRAQSNSACIREIVGLLRREPFRRYMRLWLDIVSAAGQGSATHEAIGRGMIEGYLQWLEKRLPQGQHDPIGAIALLLTLIEGVIVMDAVGQSRVADAAIEALARIRP